MLPISSAHDVLVQFPAAAGWANLVSLGNRGGFSGASMWRLEGTTGWFCLKAFPESGPDQERLHWIHTWMRTARDMCQSFVPRVCSTRHGQTWVRSTGRLWELVAWLPGAADFDDNPSSARLVAAGAALARLHQALQRCPVDGAAGTRRNLEYRIPNFRARYPAVERRLRCLRAWLDLIQSGWRPEPVTFPALPVASIWHAWDLVRRHAGSIPNRLAPWTDQPAAVQPCLCDVWRAHVLFTRDEVTGIVDYASMKIDHVAVDVSRLLGSFAGLDPAAWQAGLRGYRQVRPFTREEEALAHVLDETGTVLALANWLRWLFYERRAFQDEQEVVRRFTTLVQRFERTGKVGGD
jgi:Ser/Thr protein kinase RdoA (MazF antagonist)